jgi:hypothetical protein
MNTQDQIWIIQNQIHEIKLTIATQDIKNYTLLYDELHQLEQKLKRLLDECD